MQIDPMRAVDPLWSTMPLFPEGKESGKTNEGVPIFSEIFGSAIEQVKETDAAKNQAEYLMATGQLDNPAVLSIASSKAQLSLDLLIQLRNKALEAYGELSRMSV